MRADSHPKAATRPICGARLAQVPGLTLAADLEPLLRNCDLARLLTCDVRTIERMRSAGRLPRPDLIVGRRSPRWKPETIRRWVEGGGRS